MVVIPELLTFTLAGIVCATSRARGDWVMLARISGTDGATPVIQVVAPEEIIVPAGDGVRGGAPRLNDDEMFDTFEGGVGARIGNVFTPLGAPIFVAGPLGAKVFEVGDRVTVIEVCVNVLDGKAVSCVRPDASTMYVL